jgi:hypothetical protein
MGRVLGLFLFILVCSFPWPDTASGQARSATAPISATAPSIPLDRIPRVARAPRIDDFTEDRPREAELAVRDFRQYLPGDGAPGSETTSAYLSYSDKYLYVVFVCEDVAGQVRAHLSKREGADQDDTVGVLLDTFRDQRRAYYFAANPLGIQSDAIYTEGQGYDFTFDTLWYTEGRLTNKGYVVWFQIPFKSLRFARTPEQTWGIALYRVILRKSEYLYWPYITQRVQGLTQQLAPVSGLENISPGRNIQLIPYGLLARSSFLDQRDPANPARRTDFEHRGGLDAKFVVRDALTFDVTLNPDFSQVESNEPQVTINQRFEVFFPEKRPFFIENAGFFATPINLFFSRRVADPQFGGRMTGKVGHWALGVIAIDDRRPGQGQPSGSPFDTRAGIGVVRVAREFGRQSHIGVLFSSRDFADTSNRVASIDARFKLTPNWVLEGQAVHSWTRQNPALPPLCFQGDDHLQGNAAWAKLSYTGRHLFYNSGYEGETPGFCTELGFVNRVDIRKSSNFLGYLWRPEKSKVLDFGPSGTGTVIWDHTGRLTDWGADFVFQVDFPKQTTFSVTRREAFELFHGLGFRKHLSGVSITSQPYKWLGFSTQFTTGTGENFFPGPGLPTGPPLQPFLGNTKRFSLGFTFQPKARVRLDQTYIFSRLGTREGSTPAGFEPGTSVFNNHIVRSKLNYQFTKELSLRAIFDYNATLANEQVLDLQRNLGSFTGGPVEPSKRFTSDLLLTYLLHPGTAIYVGYTDTYANLRLDPLAVAPAVLRTGSPNEPVGRLFFVKLSYLFRF